MTIRIKASRGVYRRCGVVHSTKAVDYPDDEFTPEQLETLKADPVLTVTVLEGNTVAPAQQNAAGPAKATGSGSKGGANKTAKEGGK